jgi:uncharacterized protein
MATARTRGAVAAVLTACLGTACTQPQAAQLCAAIEAGDVAAAERTLASGETDMLRQQGVCHPAFDVLASGKGSEDTRHQILRAMLKAGLDANATLSRSGSRRSGGRSSSTTRSLVEWASSERGAVEALIAAGLDTKGAAAGRAVAGAAADGRLDVVQLLVEAGASVNEVLPDQDGLPSPLAAFGLAVAGRHHAVIRYLEARGARFANGDASPVFEAARNGDVATVRRVLDSGHDPNAADPYGQPLLLRAAGYGQTAVVDLLVHTTASLDAFTMGESALQAAASEGHVPVVRVLLAAGAKPNARVDELSAPALLRAVERRHADVVDALVRAGADTNLADGAGSTPLAIAVRMRDARLVQGLLPGKPRLADVDAATGLPVLHSAVTGCEAQDYDLPFVRALVAAGADVTATDSEGRTARQKAEASLRGETRPFYKACYEARVATLKALGG